MEHMMEDIRGRHSHIDPTPGTMREVYANAYHPHRSEGFFAKRIILVEGPTEEYALPIYAEALNYPLDNLNISVVDAGGKGSMDRLYRVFNELGIPCYILFDYDKDTDDKEMLRKSQELFELVGEKPIRPTCIFVHDKLACFPSKWEVDLAPEIPEFEVLCSTARKELGLKEDSGKPLLARYVARTLTSKDPPHVPSSLKEIIQKAIKVEWVQSCLSRKNG